MSFTQQTKEYPGARTTPWPTTHLVILLCGIMGAGLYAVMVGRDLNWDLLNYHFYNGWAVWTDHMWSNSIPGQLQTFQNPALDVLQYLAIANLPPRGVMFAIGAFQGIGVYLLFLIARTLRPNHRDIWGFMAALAAAVAGFVGPAALKEFGDTMGDLTLSIPILAGILFLLLAFAADQKKVIARNLFLGGLFLGLAAGAKFTMCTYIVAAVAAMFIQPPAHMGRFVSCIWLVVGCSITFFLVSGPWMLALEQHYGSPLFPFYNGIFHSPFATVDNWKDVKWLPHGVSDWLFLPFTMVVKGFHHLQREFRSIRYALVFGLFLIVLAWWASSMILSLVMRRRTRKSTSPTWITRGKNLFLSTPEHPNARADRWIVVFYIIGYFVWLKVFGYYRYLCPLEVLAPIPVLILLGGLLGNRRILTVAYVALMILMGGYMSYNYHAGRGNWFVHNYFGVHLPHEAGLSDAMIIMTSRRPIGFVVPYFPSSARFVRIQSNFDPNRTRRFLQMQLKAIHDHTGPFFLLTGKGFIESSKKMLSVWGFKVEEKTCTSIHTATPEKIALCKLSRKDKKQ